MKHSEILQLALDKHLAPTKLDSHSPGKTYMICYAIKLATDGHAEETIEKAKEITEHIEDCLYPQCTVTSWLLNNKEINISEDQLTHDQLQQYRKRWMLHLIEEYKKQGK